MVKFFAPPPVTIVQRGKPPLALAFGDYVREAIFPLELWRESTDTARAALEIHEQLEQLEQHPGPDVFAVFLRDATHELLARAMRLEGSQLLQLNPHLVLASLRFRIAVDECSRGD